MVKGLRCSCGRELTAEDIYGQYIKCPSCKQINLYVGESISSIDELFYSSGIKWHDFISNIFSPIINDVPDDLFARMRNIHKYEAMVPFVDVVNRNRDTYLVPVFLKGSLPVWVLNIEQIRNKEEIEEQLDVKKRNYTTLHRCEIDADMLNELKNNCAYVSTTIQYIPIKFLSFEYDGKVCSFASYANRIDSTGVSHITTRIKSTENGARGKLLSVILKVMCIVSILSAWMAFCYTYQQINGLLYMFIFSDGYKCLFKFIAVAAFASFLSGVVPYIVDSINDDISVYRNKYRNEKMLATAKRIFGV